MTNQQQQAAATRTACPNQDDANLVISTFEKADKKLRMAIESDIFTEVKSAEDEVNRAIEDLFKAVERHSSSKKMILRFLIEQFVLKDSAGDVLKKRVCDTVLAEL